MHMLYIYNSKIISVCCRNFASILKYDSLAEPEGTPASPRCPLLKLKKKKNWGRKYRNTTSLSWVELLSNNSSGLWKSECFGYHPRGSKKTLYALVCVSVCLCACVWRKWRTVSHQISTTFSHFKAIGLRASASITHRLSPPDTVMKSCTYKGFCEKAHGSSSGAKMECCFGDNCNGPHKSHSHGEHHHNSAGAAASSSLLLVTSLLLRLASSQLWTTLPLPAIYPLLLATFVHLFLTSSNCHFWPLTERFWSLSGLSQKNIFQNRSLFLFFCPKLG